MATHKVEDRVIVFATRGEIFLRVIDDVICADRSNQIYIPRAAYGSYFCSERFGDLDSECTYASSRPIDQDLLARMNLFLVMKRLPRGKSRYWRRGGLFERNVIGLYHDGGVAGARIFGECSGTHAEHIVAGLELRNVLANCFDLSRDIAPRSVDLYFAEHGH